MRLLSRIIAVIAASGVWLFIPGTGIARNAAYPVWPSFLSTGCSGIPGPGVSVTVSCGTGGFLLTQFNSGYACNEIDIFVNSLTGGPFRAVGTVNSGSVSNAVDINDAGNWYLQFPFPLVGNLITVQITAQGSGGSMDMGLVSVPCNVPTDTPTVNPSSTATNTPVPVTGTPTPVPSFTPLPSGHSTFTRTPTPGPGTSTATPTNTATPGPAYFNCGVTYPLLNCGQIGGTNTTGSHGDLWTLGTAGGPSCFPGGHADPGSGFYRSNFTTTGILAVCFQSVIPTLSGTVQIQFKATRVIGSENFNFSQGGFSTTIDTGSCPVTGSTWCSATVGTVTSGVSSTFSIQVVSGTSGNDDGVSLSINNIFVSSSANTPTPAPTDSPTSTFTATITPTPLPGTPTNTPVPIPGAMSTNIPTATECPGGCAVTALTAIPGMATITTVDTSPFSQLQHLSLSRNGCTAFGYVQIPYPVIHGTPALGTTNPLSVTWTLPITHDWDNTNPYSNTAIEPCAMNEIPTSLWDFTYWFSVFAIATVFIMWLIGFVGRLSGEETING